MKETLTFLPRRTPGILLHVAFLILILGGFGVLVWLAFHQTGGGLLVLYLLGALLLLGLLPVVGYRGYALLHAVYRLERDGLRVQWGLRSEDIPLTEVEWVRRASDLQVPLKLPFFSTLGAILGAAEHPDLGRIEFIASSVEDLVVIATMNKVLCLSPEDTDEFIDRFQRALEMGSLTPIKANSTVPAVYLRGVFADRFARVLIPAGLGLTLVLLIIVSLSIPNQPTLSMGYSPQGGLLEPVASVRLLLLPVLCAFLYIIGTIGGAYFFRRVETRSVSYLFWAGGVVTPFLLILASLLFLFAAH
jgi:hypothetical protein